MIRTMGTFGDDKTWAGLLTLPALLMHKVSIRKGLMIVTALQEAPHEQECSRCAGSGAAAYSMLRWCHEWPVAFTDAGRYLLQPDAPKHAANCGAMVTMHKPLKGLLHLSIRADCTSCTYGNREATDEKISCLLAGWPSARA